MVISIILRYCLKFEKFEDIENKLANKKRCDKYVDLYVKYLNDFKKNIIY